jgi:hypothetical protein
MPCSRTTSWPSCRRSAGVEAAGRDGVGRMASASSGLRGVGYWLVTTSVAAPLQLQGSAHSLGAWSGELVSTKDDRPTEYSQSYSCDTVRVEGMRSFCWNNAISVNGAMKLQHQDCGALSVALHSLASHESRRSSEGKGSVLVRSCEARQVLDIGSFQYSSGTKKALHLCKALISLVFLAPRPGLEPGTYGLTATSGMPKKAVQVVDMVS